MKATNFEKSNILLKAGNNPNTVDMPACKAVDKNGNRFVIGKFTLSEEERKKFLETGEIWICIMGGGWPPILPTVYHPFDDHGFKSQHNLRGLPDIEYRDHIDKMLRDIFWNESMTEEKWIDFVEMMNESFPFENISKGIKKAIHNGIPEEYVLNQYRKAIQDALIEKNNFMTT